MVTRVLLSALAIGLTLGPALAQDKPSVGGGPDIGVAPPAAPAVSGIDPTALIGQPLVQTDDWRLILTLTCLEPNQICGAANFSALACGGPVTYLGPNPDGSLLFREQIIFGNCIQGCELTVQADGSGYSETCNGSLTGQGRFQPIYSNPVQPDQPTIQPFPLPQPVTPPQPGFTTPGFPVQPQPEPGVPESGK